MGEYISGVRFFHDPHPNVAPNARSINRKVVRIGYAERLTMKSGLYRQRNMKGADKMSRIYRTKENYISLLKAVESAREDFGNLEYRRNHKGEEYLILTNIIGNVYMFDITGYSCAQVKHILSMIECGIKPKNMIEDTKKRMEIAKLYARKML